MSWRQLQLERECLNAFKEGNKRDVERLLPQIRQPAKVRTTLTFYTHVVIAWESSILHLAAAHGWRDVIFDLITKYKFDANCSKNVATSPMTEDVQGQTPLHCACEHGHLNIAQYLINEQHCDPKTKDNKSRTPLHYACQGDHLNIAQYLINEQHCDPKTKDNKSRTPLHYACQGVTSTLPSTSSMNNTVTQ